MTIDNFFEIILDSVVCWSCGFDDLAANSVYLAYWRQKVKVNGQMSGLIWRKFGAFVGLGREVPTPSVLSLGSVP